MASAYPGGLDSPTNPVASDTMDSVTVPHATEHANANNAIVAIETTLGVNPQGGSADVVTRLALLQTKLKTVTDAIVASATQTQLAGTALTTDINRVVTVVTAGDAVKLPAAVAGKTVSVINANVTNAIGVFPASGDAINAIAANGVYSVAATKSVDFKCAVAGTWNSLLSA